MTNELLAVDVATIKTIVERMDRELLGNGQPGRVQRLEARVSDIEKFEFQAKGVIATLGIFTTAVGAFLSKHLLSK